MSVTLAFPFTPLCARPLLSIASPPPRSKGKPTATPAVATAEAGHPADDSTSDAVLVARVVANDDRRAYATLIERHQSSVRSLLRRLTRNDHALADDLAQETFIQVYRNLNQFRGEARFSTWIYRIAYNAFLAVARSRHETEPLPNDIESPSDHGSDPAPLSRSTALKLDLERALGKLSTPERDALIHCYYLDLSHEEAAYVLQWPLGTVKTHVLRGRQKLKALLAAWAPEKR